MLRGAPVKEKGAEELAPNNPPKEESDGGGRGNGNGNNDGGGGGSVEIENMSPGP